MMVGEYASLLQTAALKELGVVTKLLESANVKSGRLEVHMPQESSPQFAAAIYKALREQRSAVGEDDIYKKVRISVCSALVLFAAARAGHGDKAGLNRELRNMFEEELDDLALSQLHLAYWHLMHNVPGSFKSGNQEKRRKKRKAKNCKATEEVSKNPTVSECSYLSVAVLGTACLCIGLMTRRLRT